MLYSPSLTISGCCRVCGDVVPRVVKVKRVDDVWHALAGGSAEQHALVQVPDLMRGNGEGSACTRLSARPDAGRKGREGVRTGSFRCHTCGCGGGREERRRWVVSGWGQVGQSKTIQGVGPPAPSQPVLPPHTPSFPPPHLVVGRRPHHARRSRVDRRHRPAHTAIKRRHGGLRDHLVAGLREHL